MISLEVNGERFNNFTEIETTISMDNVSGSFRFIAATDTPATFPISVGDACKVIVDDQTVLTGYIDAMDGSYDTETHVINIEGRSKTADLIDSSLENAVDFLPPSTIQSITEQVIADADIDDIEVVVDVALDAFGDGEIESFAPGEAIFEVLEKLARKRQVLITTDKDGNIVYTRGSGGYSNAELINNPDRKGNIKSATFRKDNSKRFNKYFIQAQQNVSGLQFLATTTAAEVVDQKSQVAIDDDIRDTRKIVVNAESASDKNQTTQRAIWEANIRRSRSISYRAVVQGHSHDSGIWETNKLINVDDVFAGINDQLLINSISFRYNLTEGSTTTITCVVQDAYTLQASEQQTAKDVDILAGLF